MSHPSNRRRVERIDIQSRRDLLIRVRELSVTGCSVETDAPLAANAVHNLSLEIGDGSILLVRAWVVHTRRETREDGNAVYITGLEFADHDTAILADLEGLFAEVAPAVSGPSSRIH